MLGQGELCSPPSATHPFKTRNSLFLRKFFVWESGVGQAKCGSLFFMQPFE